MIINYWTYAVCWNQKYPIGFKNALFLRFPIWFSEIHDIHYFDVEDEYDDGWKDTGVFPLLYHFPIPPL